MQNGTLVSSATAINVFVSNCDQGHWEDTFISNSNPEITAVANFISFAPDSTSLQSSSVVSNIRSSTLQFISVTSTISSSFQIASSSFTSSQSVSNIMSTSSQIPSSQVSAPVTTSLSPETTSISLELFATISVETTSIHSTVSPSLPTSSIQSSFSSTNFPTIQTIPSSTFLPNDNLQSTFTSQIPKFSSSLPQSNPTSTNILGSNIPIQSGIQPTVGSQFISISPTPSPSATVQSSATISSILVPISSFRSSLQTSGIPRLTSSQIESSFITPTTISPLSSQSLIARTTISSLASQSLIAPTTISSLVSQSLITPTTISPLASQSRITPTTISPLASQSLIIPTTISPIASQSLINRTTISPLASQSLIAPTTISPLASQSLLTSSTISSPLLTSRTVQPSQTIQVLSLIPSTRSDSLISTSFISSISLLVTSRLVPEQSSTAIFETITTAQSPSQTFTQPIDSQSAFSSTSISSPSLPIPSPSSFTDSQSMVQTSVSPPPHIPTSQLIPTPSISSSFSSIGILPTSQFSVFQSSIVILSSSTRSQSQPFLPLTSSTFQTSQIRSTSTIALSNFIPSSQPSTSSVSSLPPITPNFTIPEQTPIFNASQPAATLSSTQSPIILNSTFTSFRFIPPTSTQQISSLLSPTSTPIQPITIPIPSLHYLVLNINYSIVSQIPVDASNSILDTNLGSIVTAIGSRYLNLTGVVSGEVTLVNGATSVRISGVTVTEIGNSISVSDSGVIEREIVFYVTDSSRFVPATEVKGILDRSTEADWMDNIPPLNDSNARLEVISVAVSLFSSQTTATASTSTTEFISIPILSTSIVIQTSVVTPILPINFEASVTTDVIIIIVGSVVGFCVIMLLVLLSASCIWFAAHKSAAKSKLKQENFVVGHHGMPPLSNIDAYYSTTIVDETKIRPQPIPARIVRMDGKLFQSQDIPILASSTRNKVPLTAIKVAPSLDYH